MAVRAILGSRTLLVAAAGWAGVVAGHLGGYLLAIPGGERRSAHLEATGHGGFGMLVTAAAVAGAVALLCTMVGGRAERSRIRPVQTTLLLAAVQVPAFLLLEVAERGYSPAAAVSDPSVVVGLGVQAVLAGGPAPPPARGGPGPTLLTPPRRPAACPAGTLPSLTPPSAPQAAREEEVMRS